MIKSISAGRYSSSMRRTVLLFLGLLLTTVWLRAQEKPLVAGMKITRSMKVRKATYQLPASIDTSRKLIVIEGNNIVVDFNQALLSGSKTVTRPDAFSGIAILVRNGKNITLKNLRVKGYKIAILATNVEQLVIENCDLSYNFRQHLNSTPEQEHMADWMSYHHNEKDEWMRYGAGIYLRDCDSATVRDCMITGGQNGLMMTRCNNGTIINNDFSFNSGIGIGFYRSSGNTIMYNRVVFNVRGYSHGVYSRGQDSAGILVYEQSSNNLFYKNNATHGGDGFFLWAGQTTMDSGRGGCNGNRIIENDFSYAPTNGIEVTFSSNTIQGNRIYECDHGIWGGYSYATTISDNKFRKNRIAIAIEHGQQNIIYNNLFNQDQQAIRLWARAQQPADWSYAKMRDTRSAGYVIKDNSFNGIPSVYHLRGTDSLHIFDNTYSSTTTELFTIDSTVHALDTTYNLSWDNYFSQDSASPAIPVVSRPADPFQGAGRFAGRHNIRMTEWGPYDFKSPLIWLTNPTDTSGNLVFEIWGPPGKWSIKRVKGIEQVSASKGRFPATLTAKAIKNSHGVTDIFMELDYQGASIVTPFGERIPAGRPSSFVFRKFFQPLDWEVLFYSLNTSVHDPVKTGALFSMYEKKAPIKTDHVPQLNYRWWGGLKVGEQAFPQFITTASAAAELPGGAYELLVSWDDAVRVYVDDVLVLDEWNPSKYTFDESPHRRVALTLTKGMHHFRVEHLELGGFATLGVELLKK